MNIDTGTCVYMDAGGVWVTGDMGRAHIIVRKLKRVDDTGSRTVYPL